MILEELEKLTQEPVGAEELKKATDYTVGSFRLGLESTMSLGQRAGESLLTLGEIEPIESVVEKLRAVTADDVMRVAQRLCSREKAALALVGPEVREDSSDWSCWQRIGDLGILPKGCDATVHIMVDGKGWQGRYPFASAPWVADARGLFFCSGRPALDVCPGFLSRKGERPFRRTKGLLIAAPSISSDLPDRASSYPPGPEDDRNDV